MTGKVHEVYAVKYGENPTGNRGDFYHGLSSRPHDEPLPMDYFVWLIRSADHDIVVDAGFTAEVALRRKRTHWNAPSAALELLGVDCSQVPYLILSHLHYDHCGDLASFPRATFIVQEEEMAFWLGGPFLSRPEFRKAIELEDLHTLVDLNFNGRIKQIRGDKEIVDGVSVHNVGGHTAGLQVTRVRTEKGMVVLASDASHLYGNVEDDAPFAVFSELPESYRAYDTINELASARDLVIPGHDHEVFNRFDAVPGLEGIAVRIA